MEIYLHELKINEFAMTYFHGYINNETSFLLELIK